MPKGQKLGTAETRDIAWSFPTLNRIALLFLLVGVNVRPSAGETLRGVVYANSSGASAAGSGMIRLAVGGRVDDLYYSKPLPEKFSSSVCTDIGVIWTIEVHDATDILRAECEGKVDEWAHGPWALIRELLDRLRQKSPSAFELFSSRWRGSPDYMQYRDTLKNMSLATYTMFGRPGGCLEVVQTDHAKMTQIKTGNCDIQISGKLSDLSFDVVRNRKTRRFEIDRIQINR
jgi:hypothetical protein